MSERSDTDTLEEMQAILHRAMAENRTLTKGEMLDLDDHINELLLVA